MKDQQNRIVRVGQIVPSSNTTMETEIPAMLRAREAVAAERFTFHSSRMRMKRVVKEELEAMDRDSDRCALELSDARVDVLGYACLVAIGTLEAKNGSMTPDWDHGRICCSDSHNRSLLCARPSLQHRREGRAA